jgi:hypothetical protein
MRARWIAAISVIGFAAVSAATQLEAEPALEPTKEPETAQARPERVSSAPELTRDLEPELRSLEREVALLRAEVAALKNVGQPPVQEDTARDDRPALERAEERDQTLIAELDRRIASETRDEAWSETVETELRELIAGRAGARAISVECQATMCRLELEHDTPDVQEELGELILGSKAARGGGFLKPMASETGPWRSYVYLHRERG